MTLTNDCNQPNEGISKAGFVCDIILDSSYFIITMNLSYDVCLTLRNRLAETRLTRVQYQWQSKNLAKLWSVSY